jgi:hypothetical protein
MAKNHQAMTVQSMPTLDQNAKSVEGYTKQRIFGVRCNFYGGLEHIKDKCWKKTLRMELLLQKF